MERKRLRDYDQPRLHVLTDLYKQCYRSFNEGLIRILPFSWKNKSERSF